MFELKRGEEILSALPVIKFGQEFRPFADKAPEREQFWEDKPIPICRLDGVGTVSAEFGFITRYAEGVDIRLLTSHGAEVVLEKISPNPLGIGFSIDFESEIENPHINCVIKVGNIELVMRNEYLGQADETTAALFIEFESGEEGTRAHLVLNPDLLPQLAIRFER